MAVQELSKLGEPENAAAEDWLKAARSRLQLESLMAELNRQVLGEIAAAEAARRERREELAPAPSEAPSASEGAASERPAPGGSTSDDEPAPSPAPEAATPDAADESAPQSQDEADIGASER